MKPFACLLLRNNKIGEVRRWRLPSGKRRIAGILRRESSEHEVGREKSLIQDRVLPIGYATVRRERFGLSLLRDSQTVDTNLADEVQLTNSIILFYNENCILLRMA